MASRRTGLSSASRGGNFRVFERASNRVHVKLSFFSAACAIGATEEMFLERRKLRFIEDQASAVAFQIVIGCMWPLRTQVGTQPDRIVRRTVPGQWSVGPYAYRDSDASSTISRPESRFLTALKFAFYSPMLETCQTSANVGFRLATPMALLTP